MTKSVSFAGVLLLVGVIVALLPTRAPRARGGAARPDHEHIVFNGEIARIFQKKCFQCHTAATSRCR